jgi:hypothetical protein
MTLLEKLFEKSQEKLRAANIYLKEEGRNKGYELTIGDNFNWAISRYDEEQAVEITTDTLSLLDSFQVEYPPLLKVFLDKGMPKDNMCTGIDLKDSSGTYRTYIYEGNLDVMGLSMRGLWIDFNNLTKK